MRVQCFTPLLVAPRVTGHFHRWRGRGSLRLLTGKPQTPRSSDTFCEARAYHYRCRVPLDDGRGESDSTSLSHAPHALSTVRVRIRVLYYPTVLVLKNLIKLRETLERSMVGTSIIRHPSQDFSWNPSVQQEVPLRIQQEGNERVNVFSRTVFP